MADAKKALLLGDNAAAPYHPLSAVRQEIVSILQPDWAVNASEEYDELTEGRISGYDLVISYTDCWDGRATDDQTAGLIRYVAGGGSLLALHNGISLQSRYELAQLIGAKFIGHPPYGELSFRIEDGEHAITSGMERFSLEEEPYRFEFDSFTDKRVLLTYEHEGRSWPAAWVHRYGLGRAAFLMPGHHRPTFLHPQVRRLIASAARWLSGGR